MLKDQETNPDARLSNDDAKKLNALTDAITKAYGAERSMSEQELGEMSSEDLQKALVEALEEERARTKS